MTKVIHSITTILLSFSILLASEIKQEILGLYSKTKTNFIENFNLENLKSFVEERKYVIILFSTNDSKNDKINNMFFSTSIKFEAKEVFFLEINNKDFSQQILDDYFVGNLPEIRFYIYGIPKRFYLETKKPILSEWVSQIINANFEEIKDLQEVHAVDAHYIIYADSDLLKQNPAHFSVLAKLISPLTIYTGLKIEELAKITKYFQKNGSFLNQENENSVTNFPRNDRIMPPLIFAFREHDKKIIEVSEYLNLHQKAGLITTNEFADYMDCNDASLKLIVEHKIPALVYFDINENSLHLQKIKTVSKKYKDYFLFISVNLNSNNKCEQFFKEFLGVDQAESLRILDMHGKVKRYEFIGAYTLENIQLYFDNFVAGNLKLYSINEKLRKNENYQSIKLANSKAFKKIRKNLKSYAIFYVYGHDDVEFEEHVNQLKILQSVFRLNQKFVVYLLDHLRNDLDGYYHHDTPFVVLVLPTGKINYFRAKSITAEKLIRWVLELLPFLEITEPEESIFGEL